MQGGIVGRPVLNATIPDVWLQSGLADQALYVLAAEPGPNRCELDLGSFSPNLLQSMKPTKREAVVPGQVRLHRQLAQTPTRVDRVLVRAEHLLRLFGGLRE